MGIQYILTQVNNNTSSSYIVDCLDDKMIVSDFIDHRRTIEKEFKTWEQVCEWIIDNEAKNVKEKIEKKEKIKKKEKEEKR